MIRFLLKGLLRDRSRSLFPLLVVTIGVALTVLLQSWASGFMGNLIRSNSNFSTGHLKLTTFAYSEIEDQTPNDLAILDVNALRSTLEKRFPNIRWVERIRFGGLLDVPNEAGETRVQGPFVGFGIDLLSPDTREPEALNIEKALQRGRLPKREGEILLSDVFARNLDLKIGDTVTLLGSTMNGSMATGNVVVSGTVRFGIGPMDKGALIAHLSDVRRLLDMENAAGELLGYFDDDRYRDEEATRIAGDFNATVPDPADPFRLFMRALRDQNELGEYLDYAKTMIFIFTAVFVGAMSVVLWNLGLIGGLRRYGEIGLRLAIGEAKGNLYRSMLLESLLIGLAGSISGTATGLLFAWYLQVYGFDYGPMLENSSMLVSSVIRAHITTATYIVGFIPGTLSTLLGSALAGIGIYRRETAQLFKELDT